MKPRSLPRPCHMTNPQLVGYIRFQTKQQIIHKLKTGVDSDQKTNLEAANLEAQRRHITINHPEIKS